MTGTASPALSLNAKFNDIPPIIRAIHPSITTISRPFLRPPGGTPFGARCTAVRMASGDVLVFSPTLLDPKTKEAVDKLGSVKHIVLPDIEHYIYASDWKEAYPQASILGVQGLKKNMSDLLKSKDKPDLEWTGILGEDPADKKYGFEEEFAFRYCPGFVNRDVLFFHKPTKCLLTADMLFNLPAKEQFSQAPQALSFSQKLMENSLSVDSWRQKALLWYVLAKDRKDLALAAKTVVEEWKPEIIVPCHGDVIETQATEKWKNLYSWFLEMKL
ncbi:hypothetical protein M427DRAFT_58811 [Gonapodya prolifera JEL478]|uniref:DUF4336 domain-containing protein n=1 Tax=Gonapodya prolifera (strain JEL478) TaxID=1344416 RepID=A0A139A944_GONPJ|nr:hypothetical protein M427DRAFT_58811 [Gonapodya prolifera JEL478]|eukprot:KXS13267.1 hypothetical protein M427DRAFT_58811 [Gonapodya prolifera JEL478]